MSKHIYFFSNALDDPTNISRCANIVWCVWFHYSLSIWYSPRGSKNPWGPPGQVEDAVRTMSSCNCRGHGVLGHRLHRLYWQFAFFPRSNGCWDWTPNFRRGVYDRIFWRTFSLSKRGSFFSKEKVVSVCRSSITRRRVVVNCRSNVREVDTLRAVQRPSGHKEAIMIFSHESQHP